MFSQGSVRSIRTGGTKERPGRASADAPDLVEPDAEAPGYRPSRRAGVEQPADLVDLSGRQPGATVAMAPHVPELRDRVGYVDGLGAGEQVLGVAAAPVVADVPDHPIDRIPEGQRERDAVRLVRVPVRPEPPVAVFDRARPFPAARAERDARPEADRLLGGEADRNTSVAARALPRT